MHKYWITFKGSLLLFCFFISKSWALAPDHLHLRSTGESALANSLAVFYRISQADGFMGVRGDLGLQFAHQLKLNSLKRASVLAHVQNESLLVAYSQMTQNIFGYPARWTFGLDLNKPFSYLVEGQLYYPLGKFEPYISARIQNTGYSPAGEDAALFVSGAHSRFWILNGALGAGYELHPELRLAASVTLRTAIGSTEFVDKGVFHFSMQWLWGN